MGRIAGALERGLRLLPANARVAANERSEYMPDKSSGYNSPTVPETNRESQDRFEKLLNKWEEQTTRMDGVLDRLEGNSRK